MTIQSFKLNHPASSPRSAIPSTRSAVSHRVPVAEMRADALPLLGREDIADAVEIARLLAMPFPTFAQTMSDLLEAVGYTDVAAMKAMHGRGKGRNQHGGYDLRMYLPTRLTRGLVVAQVKQYREAVPRSFVDELRGTMLRLGASQGLLVTTSTFAASAIEAAQAAQYAAPVRLMDGQELARLIRQHPQVVSTPDAPQTAPLRAETALTPASATRPARPERAGWKPFNSQSVPPGKTAIGSKEAQPGAENVTLTLHFDVCLAPTVPDTSDRNWPCSDKQERRRA